MSDSDLIAALAELEDDLDDLDVHSISSKGSTHSSHQYTNTLLSADANNSNTKNCAELQVWFGLQLNCFVTVLLHYVLCNIHRLISLFVYVVFSHWQRWKRN